MENALKAKPEDIREQYESQLKALQEAYGEAMLELRARKVGCPCWARRTRHDPSDPAGLKRRWLHRCDDEAVSFVGSMFLVARCTTSPLKRSQRFRIDLRRRSNDDRGRTLVRLSDGGKPSALQQEHRSAGLPADGLAGTQESHWASTAY
jgi:hypothetical protein